jgi:hypothetical protein
VLLNDLLEARVVELRELGEVVDVGDDVAQVLLKQIEVFLELIAVFGFLLGARDGIVDFLFGCCYATNNFLVQTTLRHGAPPNSAHASGELHSWARSCCAGALHSTSQLLSF